MGMNIIEEEDTIIVVQNDNAFVIPIVNSELIQTEDVPDNIYRYAIENTEYPELTGGEHIEWPIEFEESHHLEDALYMSALNSIEQYVGPNSAEDIFKQEMDNTIDKPSIELNSTWKLYSDGSVELAYVEYNGVKFKPEV